MENDIVERIAPAAERDGGLPVVFGSGGENKPENDGGISEETTAAAAMTVAAAADEQPVTATVSAVVVDEQQQDETTALTAVPVVERAMTTVSAVVLADEQQPDETTAMAVVLADEQEVTTVSAAVEQQQEGATCGGEEVRVGRKRGRPRKEPAELMAMVGFSESAPPQKRARGRPKGTGKLQRLQEFAASFGDSNIGDTAGSNFTPYIITVNQGENIAERIKSFSEATPDSLIILSASGTVSTADLQASVPRPGVLRYEGQFNIVTLNGSHTYNNKWGGKVCCMSAQLAYPDGRLCGGAVGDTLVAATPTQITLATFKQNLRQLRRPQHNRNVTVASPMQQQQPEGVGGRLVAVAERVDGVVPDQSVLAAVPINWEASGSGI